MNRFPRRDHSDKYFLRTQNVLISQDYCPVVTAQIFGKRKGILAGIEEVNEILNQKHDEVTGGGRLDIRHLEEGSSISPYCSVMHLIGPYLAFAHLETPILGVLSRRSLVASNIRRVVTAAAGKPVIFMGARHDDWRIQTGDGYAARIGGADAITTDAQGLGFGAKGVGTIPHSLIACFRGDIATATIAFHKAMMKAHSSIKTISLVDYNNDCVRDALKVARAMQNRFGRGSLYGVRLDTSEGLTDRSLKEEEASLGSSLPGVNPRLIEKVRYALDEEGFSHVKIIVSGGFHAKKIEWFESLGVVADAYGIGSSILRNEGESKTGLLPSFDFTMDIVKVNGRPEAKVGRKYKPLKESR